MAIIGGQYQPMPESPLDPARHDSRPYPETWEAVAELRVFRTTEQRWQRLIGWRAEMNRKGWRLLQVHADSGEMVAVFGRTKDQLLRREEVNP